MSIQKSPFVSPHPKYKLKCALLQWPASSSVLAQISRGYWTSLPQEHARILEESAELDSKYHEAALKGDSSVPENAEDELDYHYICFVKNRQDDVVILDGDRKGPVNTGIQLSCNNLLSEPSIKLVKAFLDREKGENINFSLMALVEDFSPSSQENE